MKTETAVQGSAFLFRLAPHGLCIKMVLMLGQSLMVTGFTLVMLHTKMSHNYNVLHEAISHCFHGNV